MSNEKINLFGSDWEEIDEMEWLGFLDEGLNDKVARIHIGEDEPIHFKKVEQYPKVFKGAVFTFEVNEDADIAIKIKDEKFFLVGSSSHRALRQAIAESNKIMEKRE